MATHIITNNVPRFTLNWCDLTDKEKKRFDYMSEDACWETVFFRYKGQPYELGQFTVNNGSLPFPSKWAGYYLDTYFSGILVHFPDANNSDAVIVGRYYYSIND